MYIQYTNTFHNKIYKTTYKTARTYGQFFAICLRSQSLCRKVTQKWAKKQKYQFSP